MLATKKTMHIKKKMCIATKTTMCNKDDAHCIRKKMK
jgi:hypothetical protein